MKPNKKNCFTLLEMMIGISLMLIASGAIVWKIHKSIERKRFTSHLESLRSQLIVSRLLATNMQADWGGVLTFQNNEWVFQSHTLDDEAKLKSLRPLQLGSFSLFWRGKEVNHLEILFASSGEVRVAREAEGVLYFSKGSYREEWQFPDLFKLDESRDGKKAGPAHPDEINL